MIRVCRIRSLINPWKNIIATCPAGGFVGENDLVYVQTDSEKIIGQVAYYEDLNVDSEKMLIAKPEITGEIVSKLYEYPIESNKIKSGIGFKLDEVSDERINNNNK